MRELEPADRSGAPFQRKQPDLYNGNIARMATTITNPTTREVLPLGNAYRYDQLNRLVQANSYANLNLSTNKWGSGATTKYQNTFAYDANGNILKQRRKDGSGTDIDSLTYRYRKNSSGSMVDNRLQHVNDHVAAGAFPDDIDDMGTWGVGTDLNTGSREMVYDEGSEWASASSVPGGTVNTASTNAPKVGSKCAAYDNFPDNGYLGFMRSSPVSVSGKNYLTFFIRNRKAVNAANNLRVYVSLGSTTAYTTVMLTTYGYNRGMVGEWQAVSIPLSAINITGNVSRIRIRPTGSVVDTYDFDVDQMMFTTDATPNISPNVNYAYDGEGRLVRDRQEQIEQISWRVDGKVLKIKRPAASAKKNVTFEYDAMGNRVAKHVLTSSDVLEKSTYYILDASGNTMSVYERVVDEMQQSVAFYQAEKHVYGSSRLGILNDSISLLGSENAVYDMAVVDHVVGKRNYELSNHLGNVLSVVSDKPVPHDEGSDGDVDWYLADIRTAQDYSPFGVTLSGRNFTLAGAEKSRYGFQGKEDDGEVKGEGNSYDFGARMYDSRLGRWLTIDPYAGKYPNISPYCFVANKPIVAIDPNGKEIIVVVASDHHDNSFKFINAAFREFRKMKERNPADKNKTLMLVNIEGFYSQKAMDRIKEKEKKYGYKLVVISTKQELEDYVNGAQQNIHGECRYDDKIAAIKFFSHGTPGNIDMNYGESKTWGIDKDFVNAVGAENFSKNSCVTSYSCRTGAGINIPKKESDTDASLLNNLEYQRTRSGTSTSLAQCMANTWNVTVYALLERTMYQSQYGRKIFGSNFQEKRQNSYSDAETVDGKLMTTGGAAVDVKASDTMSNVNSEWWVFKKGEKAKPVRK